MNFILFPSYVIFVEKFRIVIFIMKYLIIFVSSAFMQKLRIKELINLQKINNI